jgi:hypothetical protein
LKFQYLLDIIDKTEKKKEAGCYKFWQFERSMLHHLFGGWNSDSRTSVKGKAQTLPKQK